MSKRKFDYMDFDYEGEYATLFDAEFYTREQALEIYFDEYGCDTDSIEDLIIEEEYVRWKPKMSKEDMWYMDIYDSSENRGMYETCNKNDKKAFKVWKVTG